MKPFSLLLLLFSLMITVAVSGQSVPPEYRVSGQIIEKNSGQSVPYATVIFKNDSISVKKILACDANGRFSLTVAIPQVYTLTVSAVGYREFSMSVNVNASVVELGQLTMDEGVELQEVTVTAQKPLVKIEVDKITYSMESDPEAQANNALEMLRKVPLVTVDSEENITLNGQSNFKVLVNGKSSSMMNSNLKEVLKSLPANSIKDIEVITNPPSKYDAEGVGGIINIITTRKSINGFNGSVGAGVDSRGSLNWSAYLATKVNKFAFSARYYGSQFKQPESEMHSESEYINVPDFHYSTTDGTSNYEGISNGFSGEASFEIDTLNLISLSFWGYAGGYSADSYRETQYSNEEYVITRGYYSRFSSDNTFGTLSGNIDYQKTFKKPDQTLTFSYKLDNNPSRTRTNTAVDGLLNYPSYEMYSENHAVGREQTFQADYYDPLTDKHQIEGGVKFILRQNDSNSDTYRDDAPALNTGNELDYSQYILGAYAGYVLKWKKISTKAGLRFERTWNDGVSKSLTGDTTFTNRLFNLVPYITLSYMPKQGQTIRASYTQRLSRPGIWYLNPYVNNVDSMDISYGDPALKSEISHSFELGYSYFSPKINLSLTTYASLVNNSIESLVSVTNYGGRVTTYKNIGKDQRYGVNIYTAWRPNNKLNISLNGNVGYSHIEAGKGYDISNEGFNSRANLNGRWSLWKDGSVSLYSGVYSSSVMLQGKSSTYYYTGVGVSQYMLKRKLALNLSVSDPFWRTRTYSNEYNDVSFTSKSEYINHSRTLRFSMTYNFGKMQTEVKKAKRSINNDDLKSGGDSQQQGGVQGR